MKEIEKYMTPAEASHKWGIKRATLKNKISPSTLNEEQKEELYKMIEEGLIKFFLAPNGTRKEWIISSDAMFVWFGEPRISKE
ncbi:DNA-binding protein [Bacillus thuringiensis]|nr:DNA-binding protein [Bacillus thuringiensis]MED2759309.1 DNA-binding protein [Bacillus thuringiensis]MED2771550.1 DNA-binding protein [Bacillus thuringiensis]MED2777794.1 DNA-binding protein [Bacillus thuringiensis]MED2783992.1 DNA-binding protein [Bacillus thuringiensis]